MVRRSQLKKTLKSQALSCRFRDSQPGQDSRHCRRGQARVPITPLPSSIVFQIPGDLSRCPGAKEPGPPWLPQAEPGLPAFLQSQKSQN